MATNALKEAKLSSTLCRLSPPSSPIHPFFTSSQASTESAPPTSRERSKTAPAAPTSSRGKSKAKVAFAAPATIPESDIENHPEAAMALDIQDAPRLPAFLPQYSYKDYSPVPAVVYTPDEEEANDLVQCLKGPVMGFDLEWVVLFRKGRSAMSHRTALVQICDARMILLVHVSAMKKFPQKVKELIENKDIAKLGANIKNDGQKLFRDYGILARNLVELGAVARQVDPSFAKAHKRSIVSLAKVVETYTQKTLSKGPVRTSNWETKPLSESQKFYAANDAHCALVVYNRLVSLAEDAGLTLEPETIGADLAQEYQAKTVSHSVSPGEPGPSTVPAKTPKDAPPAPRVEKPTSVPHCRPRPYIWSRPLVYSGEAGAPFEGPGPSSSMASSQTSTSTSAPREPPRPQHLRAYKFWHQQNMSLPDICANLRSKSNPLAESTVISYVVRALQADPTLPFSMDRLKAFVQLEAGSWVRHREWIMEKDGYAKS
ncbi:ribonuclease H-like protein [Trametes versicolor FP-101664 SS1]|uniref:ribonuclease H-like protein n=1 Tax=Trametes versicolor (strain FP-101664) TaxID=717944 RepID=UPI0004622E80|nr:ribonuclease H-like protein [Trametes versicolor FP-101664 SS1]EIW53709.1 ribonuclease H-like protein [Trametes versicolor FP-101664 SS1]